MHHRIVVHFLKSKKNFVCQSVTIENQKEKFVILPNHVEMIGNGVLTQYKDLSNEVHTLDVSGIFYFKASELFFI